MSVELPFAIGLCVLVAVAVATIMELRADELRLQLRRAESDHRLALELLRIRHRYTLRRLKIGYRHVVRCAQIRHRSELVRIKRDHLVALMNLRLPVTPAASSPAGVTPPPPSPPTKEPR